MMKTLALMFALASVSLSAQAPVPTWGSGWCPTCYVASYVDIPSTSAAPYVGYLAGWAFQCENGAAITKVDVYYTDSTAPNGQRRVLDAMWLPGGERLDVQRHFVRTGTCPKAPSNSGWAIWFPTPIPKGTRTISIVLWYQQIASTSTRTVMIQ